MRHNLVPLCINTGHPLIDPKGMTAMLVIGSIKNIGCSMKKIDTLRKTGTILIRALYIRKKIRAPKERFLQW